MKTTNIISEAKLLASTVAISKKEVSKLEDKVFAIFEDLQGLQGPKGHEGPEGPKGDKGVKGDKGEKGDTGNQGPQGDIGKTGDRGEKGSQGPQGEVGPQGEQGVRGYQGERGATGPIGHTGPQGVAGERGLQGIQGPTGETGPQGEVGPQGDAGRTGDVGLQGDKGDKGERGERGEQGERGLPGPIGPAGKNGEKGDPGEDADITPFKEEIENFIGSARKSLDDLRDNLNEAAEEKESDIESFKKEFQRNLEKDLNKFKQNVLSQMSNMAGGGSVNILQMDDVKFQKRHEVEGDAILIFDSVSKKFQSESFNDIIERLQVGMEVQYDRLVDTDGDFVYIGEAAPGSARDAAAWRIKRVYELAGDDVEIIWANNTANTELVWDDRATYEYN